MSLSTSLYLTLVILWAVCRPAEAAPRNVTVDENSAGVDFGGDWTLMTSPRAAGGAYQLARGDALSKVTFPFRGTGEYYFMAPLFAIKLDCLVWLDNEPPRPVWFQDTSVEEDTGNWEPTVNSQVVSYRQPPGQPVQGDHTLHVSGGSRFVFAIFDRFIYTVDDDLDGPPPVSQTSSRSTPQSSIPSTTEATTESQTSGTRSDSETTSTATTTGGSSDAGSSTSHTGTSRSTNEPLPFPSASDGVDGGGDDGSGDEGGDAANDLTSTSTSKLSTGAIVGIAIAASAAFLGALLALVFFWRRRDKRKREHSLPDSVDSPETPASNPTPPSSDSGPTPTPFIHPDAWGVSTGQPPLPAKTGALVNATREQSQGEPSRRTPLLEDQDEPIEDPPEYESVAGGAPPRHSQLQPVRRKGGTLG